LPDDQVLSRRFNDGHRQGLKAVNREYVLHLRQQANEPGGSFPRRPEEQKRIACELTMPSGERRKFTDFIEAAQWSAAKALQGDSNPCLANGTTIS
jgi:hypothetical protein